LFHRLLIVIVKIDDNVDVVVAGLTCLFSRESNRLSSDVPRGERGEQWPRRCITGGGPEKSQQCGEYFLQWSRPWVRTRGRQSCFLSRVASNIGTIGVARGGQEAIAHQTFWTYLVILCFEKSRPKQKMLLLVKNQKFCLPRKFFASPQNFGLATPLFGTLMCLSVFQLKHLSTPFNRKQFLSMCCRSKSEQDKKRLEHYMGFVHWVYLKEACLILDTVYTILDRHQ